MIEYIEVIDIQNYLGHVFKYQYGSYEIIGALIFKCLRCNSYSYRDATSNTFRKYNIINNHPVMHSSNILLTCDEIIIKNIIE